MSFSDLLDKEKEKLGVTTPADDPLVQEAKSLVENFERTVYGHGWNIKPRDYTVSRKILDETEPRLQIAVLCSIYESFRQNRMYTSEPLQAALLARNLPFTVADLERLTELATSTDSYFNYYSKWPTIARHIRRFVDAGNSLTPTLRSALQQQHNNAAQQQNADGRKLRLQIAEMLGSEATAAPDGGESWADRALADLTALPDAEQAAWKRLFAHLQTADGSKPKAQWLKATEAPIATLGDTFLPHAVRWMNAVTLPPVQTNVHTYANGSTYTWNTSGASDKNISLLKGLAWACSTRTEPEAARALSKLAEACLKKLPGIGPWAVRAASAAIWALAEMPCAESVTQLSRLKLRITHRSTLALVERAIETVAVRQNVPKEVLEDISVTTYGLDPSGRRREVFGDCAVEMALDDKGGVSLSYFGPGGKTLKSAPAAVKQPPHADDWKALKADADAAQKLLSAQRQRVEAFLLTERAWTFGTWRERYIDHPLLGNIARRLIWRFGEKDSIQAGIWDEAAQAFVDLENKSLNGLSEEMTVRLWHPIHASAETVMRWRALLEERQMQQPFKQAHREVYLLTDAERNTHTYSNRFAGHILKQHQMNQLAAQRGWKNSLRLMVDDNYPPATLDLPQYDLRAEFWIEGIGDNYGADTTDAGTYLYLATDQVRFYRRDAVVNYAHAGGGGYYTAHQTVPAEPLPLTDIPPLVLSEVMRDVDLFVGVASVGNDPAWSDGGPQGRHINYWQEYSFGELSATAQTRRDVLERLLPRLKIAVRCALENRFLVVRGDLRTYKIHLGSGNILMEPNDQYLCIVQERSAGTAKDAGETFLPFEGDPRLSLILSKAFLLANDKAITDPTITRQIQHQ